MTDLEKADLLRDMSVETLHRLKAHLQDELVEARRAAAELERIMSDGQRQLEIAQRGIAGCLKAFAILDLELESRKAGKNPD